MKKLIIGFGTVLMIAFVMVSVVNATATDKDKKAKVEVSKEEGCAAKCAHATAACAGAKEAKCDPSSCKEHKDGKCDPATCKDRKGCEKADAKATTGTAACCKAKVQK
jgi:hypothetical protein